MRVYDIDFAIQNENPGSLTLTERCKNGDLLQLDLHMEFPTPISPAPLSIAFSLPHPGVVSCFSPSFWSIKTNVSPAWAPNTNDARLSFLSPVMTYVGYDDTNRCTVALSDVMTPTRIAGGIIEENANLSMTITLFTNLVAPISSYDAVLYIDLRRIPYYEALTDLSAFWQVINDMPACPVPDAALHPLYSFWYSYHQKFTTEEILAECKKAKEFGMETVILDDGWQTEDNNRGYAFCGDWELCASKIPDIRALVDGVHALGMKIMFWYSVPYVGIYSQSYEKFKGMYLDGAKDQKWYCLDPRFPAVRDFLAEHYRRAMEDWDLDGLKLDFIDAMQLLPTSPANDPRMDESSLERGIHKLLAQVYATITKKKPDALIEFRQGYVGPAVQQYGNMLRAGDCPNDALTNRTRTLQLRLLTPSTAVHADMLMWHPEDTAEVAARQISAILFSVPQISVRLGEIPDDHREMLRFYLSLWEKNRETLMHGTLVPHAHSCNYPLVEAVDENCRFAVAYAETILHLSDEKPLTYVHAAEKEGLFVEFAGEPKARLFRIYDCRGKLLEEALRPMQGILRFAVPSSGVLEIL